VPPPVARLRPLQSSVGVRSLQSVSSNGYGQTTASLFFGSSGNSGIGARRAVGENPNGWQRQFATAPTSNELLRGHPAPQMARHAASLEPAPLLYSSRSSTGRLLFFFGMRPEELCRRRRMVRPGDRAEQQRMDACSRYASVAGHWDDCVARSDSLDVGAVRSSSKQFDRGDDEPTSHVPSWTVSRNSLKNPVLLGRAEDSATRSIAWRHGHRRERQGCKCNSRSGIASHSS
jgi:hypothetical protein